ncbi:YdeI/OmpD-associated family protein [Dongia sp.]|uniref:YdeI/OmpD-associated family protein n=1 Tax=Dongia sp. TaxID=1977262 RepID=UPI0037528251
MKVNFRARIEIRGINPYVLVSATRAAHLAKDWRGPMPVLVQVNGRPELPHRINLMPAGDGSFFLYLDATVRKAAAIKVGDTVRVGVDFNPDYRGGPVDPMPRWFSQALNRNPAAKQGWTALPPSRQKEILRYFARLKSEAARVRNLEKALHVLAGGKARFMARAWSDGR